MRCSCGKTGTRKLARRELPYCDECFKQLISQLIRSESKDAPILLKPTHDFFFDAVKTACEFARREVIEDAQGATPGCAEIAAAHTIQKLLGRQAETNVFPKNITLQELQMFFKAEPRIKLDTITEELIHIEQQYPGTINAINKQAR